MFKIAAVEVVTVVVLTIVVLTIVIISALIILHEYCISTIYLILCEIDELSLSIYYNRRN